ncbi:hypothetical protein [Desulfuromonas versatilis]|uniref:hypothetical protein n=1 Tax=Desulfuromonas versatilis TaxID=2802975 RepID=UPI001C85A89C|nr:hypothetical protein [Desulfuromonas versatilis]
MKYAASYPAHSLGKFFLPLVMLLICGVLLLAAPVSAGQVRLGFGYIDSPEVLDSRYLAADALSLFWLSGRHWSGHSGYCDRRKGHFYRHFGHYGRGHDHLHRHHGRHFGTFDRHFDKLERHYRSHDRYFHGHRQFHDGPGRRFRHR